ncbi:MAG: hypothetical protein E6Q85_02760 [Thiothrix sp.]|nr:MAG: hypothetical protein E6Q85_02760 [Thiothrix sp.]
MEGIGIIKVTIFSMAFIMLTANYLIFKKYKWSGILLWLGLASLVGVIQYLYESIFLFNTSLDKVFLTLLSSVGNLSFIAASSYFDFGVEVIKKIKKTMPMIFISLIILMSSLLSYLIPDNTWFKNYPDIFISIVCIFIFWISLSMALIERKFYSLAFILFLTMLLFLAHQYLHVSEYGGLLIRSIVSSSGIILCFFYLITPLIWLHRDLEHSNVNFLPSNPHITLNKTVGVFFIKENKKILWEGKTIILPPQAFFDLLTFIKYKKKEIYDGCISLNDKKIDIDHRRIYRLKKYFQANQINLPIIRGERVGYYYLSIPIESIQIDKEIEKFLN